ALLRDTTRGPVVGLVAAQVRIPTDVQAQQPPLSGVPHGVDGEATRLRVLVPPTAQQDALAAAVSADMRLQSLLGQAADERERLLDGRQAPVSIHPRELATELEQRPGFFVRAAVLSGVAGERLEAFDRCPHVTHGSVDLPELLEKGEAPGNAFSVGKPLG